MFISSLAFRKTLNNFFIRILHGLEKRALKQNFIPSNKRTRDEIAPKIANLKGFGS